MCRRFTMLLGCLVGGTQEQWEGFTAKWKGLTGGRLLHAAFANPMRGNVTSRDQHRLGIRKAADCAEALRLLIPFHAVYGHRHFRANGSSESA